LIAFRTLTAFSGLAALALASMASMGPAQAQNAEAVACITQLQEEHGNADGLNSECASDRDCSFLAPAGNASARGLLATIADSAQSCFEASGLSNVNEEKQDLGVTRIFNGEGEGQCAVLVNTPSGPPPEGVRLLCREE